MKFTEVNMTVNNILRQLHSPSNAKIKCPSFNALSRYLFPLWHSDSLDLLLLFSKDFSALHASRVHLTVVQKSARKWKEDGRLRSHTLFEQLSNMQ